MAITLTVDTPRNRNEFYTAPKKVRIGTGNCGTGYPTGGAAIDAAALKVIHMTRIDYFDVQAAPGIGRIFVWDKANGKVRVDTALATEAANASDQSAQTFRFIAIGT
jgi:hypothetical protein